VKRTLLWLSLLLAGFVGFRELAYFLDHRNRPGPALMLVMLAAAVVLLSLSQIIEKRGDRG
jgi:hypothetical protein